jgi:hypothetical protein
MKYIYKILLISLITSVSCKAQSPIIDIEKIPSIWDNPQTNAYYKDIHNFLDEFEGTWIAIKGNNTFKIVLKKLKMVPNNVPYYVDYMIGGYQYIENGVEKINTLDKINIQYVRSIYGYRLLKSHFKPTCNDCNPNKRRLNLSFIDRERDVSGSLYLQHITVNGAPALKAILWGNGKTYNGDNPPAHLYLTVPTGEYIFIKQ